MKENELTPEKSLQVITETINKSRRDFEKDSGKPMILWGIIVMIFSIVIWIILRKTGQPIWNMLWFGIPAVGFPLCTILLSKM